jgi:hypothetical protein
VFLEGREDNARDGQVHAMCVSGPFFGLVLGTFAMGASGVMQIHQAKRRLEQGGDIDDLLHSGVALDPPNLAQQPARRPDQGHHGQPARKVRQLV